MNYNENYLNKSLIIYPPKLKMYRSILMLTQTQKNEIAAATNDSALRLYELYISKRGWKHYNPTDFTKIGEELGWTRAKTEKTKTMLIKAGLLLIIKDTLRDSSTIYRLLLGIELVNLYKDTGKFPTIAGEVDTINY